MKPSPAAPFDRRTQDVGNVVEFGHLNLRVPDQQMAIVFYVTGLGLTRDPYLRTGVDNAWINVGTCQFHLPTGPAQRLRGRVGLVQADLDALLARLAAVRPLLAATQFGFVGRGSAVDVTCPWGNRIRVHAPDISRFGSCCLGMPYVEVDVAPGTVSRIGRFYTEIMGARTEMDQDGEGPAVHVHAGPGERLVFRETPRALPPYDGHHVQITVADFSGVHRRLLDRGLVTEESSASQYRFQDIVDLDDGVVLTTLEHEVRSVRHPMFARKLVNRNPAVDGPGYAAGLESAIWQLPPD